MSIKCPNCNKSVGGKSTEGGYRVRLGILLIDPETGVIKGPCPHCKKVFSVAEGASLSKNITTGKVVPAFRIIKA